MIECAMCRRRFDPSAPGAEASCDGCGLVPVPESDLPVLLPTDVPFTGSGMLARTPNWEYACSKALPERSSLQ